MLKRMTVIILGVVLFGCSGMNTAPPVQNNVFSNYMQPKWKISDTYRYLGEMRTIERGGAYTGTAEVDFVDVKQIFVNTDKDNVLRSYVLIIYRKLLGSNWFWYPNNGYQVQLGSRTYFETAGQFTEKLTKIKYVSAIVDFIKGKSVVLPDDIDFRTISYAYNVSQREKFIIEFGVDERMLPEGLSVSDNNFKDYMRGEFSKLATALD